MFFLGQLPGEYAFSIAGQLNWVNLIYEVASEAIILPLYYFIGKAVEDREELKGNVLENLYSVLGRKESVRKGIGA